MARNSILNRLNLQRSTASKEIGYQNLKIDEPPGSLDGNHRHETSSNHSTVTPDHHISSSQYIANLHSTTNSVSPPPPRTRNRTSFPRWCKCLCCICVVGLVLLLIAIGLALAFYFIVRPRRPELTVKDVGITSLLLTFSNNTANDYDYDSVLNLDLVLAVDAYNPNKRISIEYTRLRVDVYYQNMDLAIKYLEPFSLKKGGRLLQSVEILGNPILQRVISRDLSSEMNNNVVNLVTEVSGKVRMKVEWIGLTRSFVLHSRCYLQVTPPTGPTGPQLLSKSCKMGKGYRTSTRF